MRLIEVDGIRLEVQDLGTGEAVVLVQTALTADELVPLAEQLVARGGYRALAYHRRGYAGSSPVSGPGSVLRDAADCRDLIVALGLDRAHLVGYSYSCAVALQLAVDAATHVHTMTLIEPPPVRVPSSAEFRAANAALQESSRAYGPGAALEEFLALLAGPDWRAEYERRLPGAVEQMQRDARTFFDIDLPALLSWRFGAEDARRVGCPVLHIGGSASGPWFAEVREQVRGWFPHADDVVLAGADHTLVLTRASEVADALSTFLGRNPIR